MAQPLPLASSSGITAEIIEGSVSVPSTQRAPGGFTVYRVAFKVKGQTPEGIAVIQECEVWKRFSDFQQLSRQLEVLHSQSKSVAGLPTIVKASYFDRFKESVIEERRRSAAALLQFASRYHHLASSTALLHFLTGATVVRIIPEVFEPPSAGADTQRTNTEMEQEQPDTSKQLAPQELNGASGSHLDSPGSQEPLPQTVVPGGSSSRDHSHDSTSPIPEGNTSKPSTAHAEVERTTPTDVLTGVETGDPSTGSRGVSEDRDLSAVSSCVVSSQENLIDFDGSYDGASKATQVPTVVGSVKITEWGLEHNLSLRDEEGAPTAPDYTTTLPDISEEEDRLKSLSSGGGIAHKGQSREDQGRGEADLNDSVSTSGESSSESGSLPAGTNSLGGGLVFPQGDAEALPGVNADSPLDAEIDVPPKKAPEDSLDLLNFDLNLPPTAARPNAGASSNGFDWWGEAFAETQNMTDDFDTLVEQLDENSPAPGAARARLSAPQSQQPSHGALKPAKSDSSIVDSVKSLGEVTSSSEQVLTGETGATGHRKSRSLLRRLSDQMNSSPTESQGSAGKDRKSSSATNSRSPSPSRRRNSPSISDSNAYVIQAGRLIAKALEFEQGKEWGDAFDLFKAAVDVLLNGVQTDRNKQRREMVRRKTVEYLQYAEELYQKHLAQPTPPAQQHTHIPPQAARPAPVTTPAVKPHLLPDFKVIGTIGKVILVESKHTGQAYVFKVLHRSAKAAASGRGRPKKSKNLSPPHSPHMVRLLHHYETSNQRIFLLLEHVNGGHLINFVNGKREQWKRLKEAALNPSPLTLLRQKSAAYGGNFGMETKLNSGIKTRPSPDRTLASDSTKVDESLSHSLEKDDDEMDRMLNELSSIVPPTDLPVTSSLGSNATEGDSSTSSETATDSLDRLALMRKRLEECSDSEAKPDGARSETTSDREHPVAGDTEGSSEERNPPVGERVDRSETGGQPASTAINIQPPTPTVSTQESLGNPADDTRTGGRTGADTLTAEPWGSGEGKELVSSGSSPGGTRSATSSPKGSPRQSSPCFSPGSQHGSPNVGGVVDEWGRRLEDSVRTWAAQIVLCLEHLHIHGVICRDLNPDNVLLANTGQAVLTYFGKWDFVEQEEKYELLQMLYVAPELQGLVEPTEAADWWSLGALLFEVLTGKRLVDCHPGGVHSHIPLRIPTALSPEAQSLLKQLLQVNPNERLGCGLAGVEEIKAHPFFTGTDWTTV